MYTNNSQVKTAFNSAVKILNWGGVSTRVILAWKIQFILKLILRFGQYVSFLKVILKMTETTTNTDWKNKNGNW